MCVFLHILQKIRINRHPLNRLLISLPLTHNSVGNPLVDVWGTHCFWSSFIVFWFLIFVADLKPWVSNFTYPGVQDFSQLALDANRNQLIVGAR